MTNLQIRNLKSTEYIAGEQQKQIYGAKGANDSLALAILEVFLLGRSTDGEQGISIVKNNDIKIYTYPGNPVTFKHE